MPIYPIEDDPALGLRPSGLPAGYAATPDPNKIEIETVGEPPNGDAVPSTVMRRVPPPNPTHGEVTKAAYAQENPVYGAWKQLSEEKNFGPYDPEHNPFTEVVRDNPELQEFAGSFIGSANLKHSQAIANRIRDELKNRKILQDSGWHGTLMQAAASVFSPTNLLPGGAIYKTAKVGSAAIKGAASVGAANAVASGIDEAVLQSGQFTRSGLESGFNIGGSFLLGGILGGAASGVSSKRFIAMARALDDELSVGPRIAETIATREGVGTARLNEVAIGGGGQGGVGAQMVRTPDLELASAGGMERAMAFATPDLRTLNATSPVAREVGAQLFESSLAFTRNADGFTTAPRGGSVETRYKTQGVAREGQAVQGVRELWAQYRFGDAKTKVPGLRAMLDRGSGKLTEKEFRVEVGHAMSRNDTHDIPEVAAAAKHVRKTLIDPIADAAIKYKLLDPEVVAKGRPKGGGGEAGGAPAPKGPDGDGPTPPDPAAVAQATDIARQFEKASGIKLDAKGRKAAVDLLLSDNDMMRQVRSMLGIVDGEGDNIPFAALDAAVGARMRAEVADVFARLDAGETVDMPAGHVEGHYAKLGTALTSLPDGGASVGVVSRLKPLADGRVQVSIVRGDGSRFTFPQPFFKEDIAHSRAFYERPSGLTVFSRLYDVGSVSSSVIRGELRHENVHSLWRSLDVGVRDRLVGHARSLRVMDVKGRDYFELVESPHADGVPPDQTLFDLYENHYSKRFTDYKAVTERWADVKAQIADDEAVARLLGDTPADRVIADELETSVRANLAEERELMARLTPMQRRLDAMMAEEYVAHMIEMREHGMLTDTDLAPVLDDIRAAMGIDYRAETWDAQARPMSAIDAATGQAMRRDLDQLGYYSHALEVARGLKQAKGTPEQMLAMLKKGGVKDAEIAATKLGELLSGNAPVTRAQIISHLEENRVGLKEVVRAPPDTEALDNVANMYFGERFDDISRDQQRRIMNEVGGDNVGGSIKWQSHSLDPSNPTYRETVLHLPDDARTAIRERLNLLNDEMDGFHQRASAGAQRVPLEEMPRFEELRKEIVDLHEQDKALRQREFGSGHFPEPNIVGHMMTSMVTDGKGKPVYLIDQIQSDWGQKLREGGVRDEAKIKELTRNLDQARVNRDMAYADANKFVSIHGGVNPRHTDEGVRLASALMDVKDVAGKELYQRVQSARSGVQMAEAELRTAEAATPGNPLVNTTDQWVNITLRRAIRQAAESDADAIAIPSGKTVLSYNPGDEAGMEGFYNGIVPKNLRNLLARLDKSAGDGEKVAKLVTPTKGEAGEGFTVFRLTPAVKRAVLEDGQPMFALGNKTPEQPAGTSGATRPDPASLTSRIMEAVEPYLSAYRAAETAGLGVERDASGQVTSVVRDGRRYAITRDADGNVSGISETPMPDGPRDLAVSRDATGAASGLDDGAVIRAQEMQIAAREALNGILGGAAKAFGLKGLNPARIDELSGQIIEAAQRALADGGSPEAAVSRSVTEAVDPVGTMRDRIMSALAGDGSGRQSVLSIIRSMGGIKDTGGDLRSMFDRPGSKGHPPGLINNKSGASLDALRERLVEEGWFHEAPGVESRYDQNSVLDLIDSEVRNRKASTNDGFDADRILYDVYRYHEENGIHYSLTEAEEARLLKHVKTGMSIEDASERVAMETMDEFDARAARGQSRQSARNSGQSAGRNGQADGPRGDGAAGSVGESGDPVANLQAKRLAREFQERVKERLEADSGGSGGFSKEIGDQVWDDGGQSYITRIYNRVKIIAQRAEFARIITDYFAEAQTRAGHVLRRLQSEAAQSGTEPNAALAKNIDDLHQFTGLSRQELADSAEQVIRHILGVPEGRLMFDLPAAVRGPLKARTLRIPDALIEDFLERDINVISRFYTRTMVPDVELARMFGSIDMEEAFSKIKDDYTKLMLAAPDEATRLRLQTEMERVLTDVDAMAARIRGTYKLPDDPMSWPVRIARLIKAENFISKLGGMTISAISDPFRAMMTHGVTSFFRDGVGPLLQGLRGMKLAGDELRLFGAAWDMTLSSRTHNIADVMDDYGRYSKFERGVGWVQDKFSFLTLMNQWNTALKTFSGTVIMTNTLRRAIKVAQGQASKKEIAQLAAAGIDAHDARIIADQFQKHGGIVNGVYLPDTAKWDVSDPNVLGAMDSFKGAVVRDVDRTIVTPGQDKPLMASTTLGSVVFQFKSFGFASMQRTLIAGLQQRDAGVLMGSVMMVGMGAVSEWLKALTNKKELPKNNAQWIATAVDRSGLLAWLPDINHVAEQASGGQFGVAALTGKELSRYASRNFADSALGPTGGMMKDMFGATSGISRALTGKERLRQGDIAALRRVIPFNNLFYLSYLFQSLEESAGQALGAQPATRRTTPGR